MNGERRPNAGVARLYLHRKKGRRGLITAEDCSELATVDIVSNVGNHEDCSINAASHIGKAKTQTMFKKLENRIERISLVR